MEKVAVKSALGIVGSWAGREAELPHRLKNTPLWSQIEEVRDRHPDYERLSPEILRQKQMAVSGLMAMGVTARIRNELLGFWGNEKDLMQQAWLLLKKYAQSPADIQRAFEQLEMLRSLKVQRLYKMLTQERALDFETRLVFDHTNRVLDYLATTFSSLLRGVAAVGDDLEVQNIAIGANYTQPSSSQTDLLNQIGSDTVPDASTYTGYQTTFIKGFLPADNNGLATTITSVAGPGQFDIASTSGLAIGDRVIVNGEKRTVQNLAGSTVTLDQALSAAPSIGAAFRQIWAESGLRINTGNILGTRSRFADGGYDKVNTKAIFVESAVTLRIVGA